MALHSLYCADVPLRNCSLTHPHFQFQPKTKNIFHVERSRTACRNYAISCHLTVCRPIINLIHVKQQKMFVTQFKTAYMCINSSSTCCTVTLYAYNAITDQCLNSNRHAGRGMADKAK